MAACRSILVPRLLGSTGPGVAAADGAVDGPGDCRGQRDQDDLAAFAADPQYPVAVFFAQVADIGAGGFEDPQAQ